MIEVLWISTDAISKKRGLVFWGTLLSLGILVASTFFFGSTIESIGSAVLSILFSVVEILALSWLIGTFIIRIAKSIKKNDPWVILVSIVIILGLLGGVLNLTALITNGGRMPVVATDQRLVEESNHSFVHFIANNHTKLSFLIDYQISSYIAASIGDFIISGAGWTLVLLSLYIYGKRATR